MFFVLFAFRTSMHRKAHACLPFQRVIYTQPDEEGRGRRKTYVDYQEISMRNLGSERFKIGGSGWLRALITVLEEYVFV